MSGITPNMAVIIENLPDTTIDDYLQGVGNSVGAACITHASRIAGGRVCVFLKSEDAVNSVVADGFLTVKEQYVPIRRYNTAATKIIMSNVFPFISNEQLALQLRKYGTLTAPIRDLTTGSRLSECMHIKSFRRIAYVLIKDLSVVPETMTFDIDGQKLTVYLSMDEVVCMRCRNKGHIAKYCKTLIASSATLGTANTFSSVVSAFPPLKNMQPPVIVPISFTEAISIPSSRSAIVGIPVVVVPPPAEKMHTTDDISNRPSDASNEVTTLMVKSPTPQQRIDDYNNSNPTHSLSPSRSPPLPTLSTKTATKTLNDEDDISTHGESAKRRLDQRYDGDALVSESISSTVSNEESFICDMAEVDVSTTCTTIMTPETLKDFLNRTRHFKKILPIARKFTSNFAALSSELENLIPKQKDLNMRRRLERIVTAIAAETNYNG